MAVLAGLTFSASLASARSDAAMFPFPIQTLNVNHDATDMSWLNECPAGKSGFIHAKDGHFVDGQGKRVRFLGVNLCFSGAFPDHETAEKVAARLAKLGVNCVRLHHMDGQYAPNGIWDPAFKDKQHLDAGQLDRLDYLIYMLKAHGVYVDINLHVARQFGEADGFPDAEGRTKYDKGLDNFEPKMIALQKDYARQLLTHRNPYTKTRYVDEPSVALIEINNENSLVSYCMDGTIADIPDCYLSQLKKKWNDWLKTHYGTTEKLRAAWKANSEPMGDNILTNSDFSAGKAHWVLEAPSPAEATMEVVDAGPSPSVKALHAKLTHVGTESWNFQVHQVGLNLDDGKPYTLRFWARANEPRTVNVYTGLDIAPWRTVGIARQVKLAPQWRRYEFTFYASHPEKDHNRVTFNLQSIIGEVWIAGVELRRGGGGGLPDGESVESGNVSLPFTAYTPPQRADFLGFSAEVERAYALGMHDYIKKTLGAKAQVVDTQTSYGGLAGLYQESLLDYGDMHGYWQHPSFPRKPWDPVDWRISNSPMVKALGTDALTRIAECRIAGKPFTVSEYNHPVPSDYAAECVPMLAAFAAHQDWDGVFLFDYHSGGSWEKDSISSFFQCDSNPSKIVFFPVAAAMLRRADVAPVSRSATLEFPLSLLPTELARNGASLQALWQSVGFMPADGVQSRTGVRFGNDGKEPILRRQSDGSTSCVTWEAPHDGQAEFLINSPASRGVIGFAAGSPVKLGGLSIAVKGAPTSFAVITVTALDGKPIEQSAHLLVCACGRVENKDMIWNEDRTSVGDQWGHGPVMAEGVSAEVTLTSDASSAQAFALDGGGGRSQVVPCSLTGGRLTLNLGPESQTLWYEVRLSR